jgi:two-component system, OmpR family, response regulator
MPLRVLLVDDDARLFELLRNYLAGHEVSLAHAPDGPRGLALLDGEPFDAVLLDVMMPGLGGLAVLERLRQKSDVPVLMLTARGDEADRVVGLEMGADDYVAKPFSARELLARLRAVLRRGRTQPTGERLAVGPLVIDGGRREVRVRGEVAQLTGLEFDLLVALARRRGRVIPREALLAEAGRSDAVVSDRTVDVHISHLRHKLGDDSQQLIRTVRGVGYVMVDPAA